MKLMRTVVGLIVAALLAVGVNALAEQALTLPDSLNIIGAEAFYGDASIGRVALPDGVTEIHERAFANSGLTEINLPDSLEYIDDTAFEGLDGVMMTANEGSYAWEWAVENGYIERPSGLSVANVRSFAGHIGATDDSVRWTVPGDAIGAPDIPWLSDANEANLYGIEADGEWMVQSDCAWMEAEKVLDPRYHEYCVRIAAAANEQGAARTGNLIVSGGDEQKIVSVIQQPRLTARLVAPAAIANYGRDGRSVWDDELTYPDGYAEVLYGDIQLTCAALAGASDYRLVILWGGDMDDFIYREYEPDAVSAAEGVRFTISKWDVFPGGSSFMALYAGEEYENGNEHWYLGEVYPFYVEWETEDAPGGWRFMYDHNASGEITGAIIHWYNGTESDLVIPDTLGGYPVTGIRDFAFSGCEALTSVTIPNSVMSIAGGAFSYCHNLTDIAVASGNTVLSSQNGALLSKDQTRLIAVPAGKTGGYAVPNSVTSIGERAFEGCEGLMSITIPNGVTSVGENAFNGCEGLMSIAVGSGNTVFSSQNGALLSKDQTRLIAVPAGKTGGYAVPDSVTSIDEYAFENCHKLTSVSIPNSVTSIGREAFAGCYGLTSITISNSVTSIGYGTFYRCEGLTSITIPNGVTSIGEQAFSGCEGLTSIDIPNSVTSIAHGVFFDCYNLTSIAVGSGNTVFSSQNGALLNKDQTRLIMVPMGKTGAYAVPNIVTSIGDGAFSGCSGLTSIDIPNGVTSIGEYAFFYCEGLTRVSLPESLISIGDDAFYGCYALTEVVAPQGSYAWVWAEENGFIQR